jgi:nucleotide-binding universal stress UspA family protein
MTVMPTTMLRGPVFVGTDLTPASEEALRQGAQLARDLAAPLIACHILPELLRVGMLFPQWRGVDRHFEQSMTGKARGAVTREVEAVLGGDAGGVQIVLDSGTAHAGLLAQAEATGAGVIVIGPGQVAEQIVRHASLPVLVARPSPHGPVVGATDFSDPSLPALTAAAAEAKRRKSPLHLIYALDTGIHALGSAPTAASPYLANSSAIALEGLDELRSVAELRLREAMREFAVEGRTSVMDGRAAHAIVSYAETVGAELVVVGTHGRSGLPRMTLGSTAAGVIDSAPSSVLVVRVAGLSS